MSTTNMMESKPSRVYNNGGSLALTLSQDFETVGYYEPDLRYSEDSEWRHISGNVQLIKEGMTIERRTKMKSVETICPKCKPLLDLRKIVSDREIFI